MLDCNVACHECRSLLEEVVGSGLDKQRQHWLLKVLGRNKPISG
ncbi:hypothetical protein DsansV1_C32g0222891 [Dioscorea sansibarensis]